MATKPLKILPVILSLCFTIFCFSLASASKPLPECPPDDGMIRETPGVKAGILDDTNPEQKPAETKPRDECARWEKTCNAWKDNWKKWNDKYDNTKPANKQRYIILRMNDYAYNFNANCPKNCPGYGKLPVKPLPK